jgi:ribosome assembly protein YihI (activator of Der GTPase)
MGKGSGGKGDRGVFGRKQAWPQPLAGYRVRFACSTHDCPGSWYDGNSKPTTCYFCKKQCCWDYPYFVATGKAGKGSGGKSKKGKPTAPNGSEIPTSGKGPGTRPSNQPSTHNKDHDKIADPKLLSASLLDYLPEEQVKEYLAQNGITYVSPIEVELIESQDELNERLQRARGTKKSMTSQLEQKLSRIKRLANDLEDCINKRDELMVDIATQDSIIDDLYPKVHQGDKANLVKLADQNVDNFITEGELRKDNIAAYLTQLQGKPINLSDIEHITAQFDELSKNAQCAVKLTKQSYDQSLHNAGLDEDAEEVSEAGDRDPSGPIVSVYQPAVAKAAATPPRANGSKRAGDDNTTDSTMDGSGIEAMQTLAKAQKLIAETASLPAAT